MYSVLFFPPSTLKMGKTLKRKSWKQKTLKKRGGQTRSFPLPIAEFNYETYRQCSDFRLHLKKGTTFYQCDAPYIDMLGYDYVEEFFMDPFLKTKLEKDIPIYNSNVSMNASKMATLLNNMENTVYNVKDFYPRSITYKNFFNFQNESNRYDDNFLLIVNNVWIPVENYKNALMKKRELEQKLLPQLQQLSNNTNAQFITIENPTLPLPETIMTLDTNLESPSLIVNKFLKKNIAKLYEIPFKVEMIDQIVCIRGIFSNLCFVKKKDLYFYHFRCFLFRQ